MEKQKLLSIKNCFRISTLICLFVFKAQAFTPVSYGVDLGFSGSLLLTDADGNNFGLGSGSQIFAFTSIDINKDYLLKLQLAQVSLEQSLFNETLLQTNLSLVSAEQKYHLVLAGIEKNFDTWFWEGFSGFSIGKRSEIKLKDSSTGQAYIQNARTKSFIVLGAAIGYRIKHKNFHIISRAKTFSPLSNVYKDSIGKEDFYFVLPLMMSLGLEW